VFNVAGSKFVSGDPAKLPGNSGAPTSSGLASPVGILVPVLNIPIGCRLLENMSFGAKFSVVPVCSAEESNADDPNNAGPVPLLLEPNKLVLLVSVVDAFTNVPTAGTSLIAVALVVFIKRLVFGS
jgi:hypothetical protein